MVGEGGAVVAGVVVTGTVVVPCGWSGTGPTVGGGWDGGGPGSVSYTHLTLPTTPYV